MAAAIASRLRSENWQVECAPDGAQALERHRRLEPQLMILDWQLPLLDGLEVLRRVRQSDPHLPVLMLSVRDEEADRVIGLEMGADDYLTKPFGMRELIARVRALLRRTRAADRELPEEGGNGGRPLRYGELVFDPRWRSLRIGSRGLDLTPIESSLLELLLRNPGRAFSRDYLLDAVWGRSVFVADRAVDNAVLRLRRKLGDLGAAIETVWGLGYRLAPLERFHARQSEPRTE